MTERSIHIRSCVFGGRFVVTVEPRTIDLPSEEFRTVGLARTRGESLGKANGWSIVDHVGYAA